MAFDSPAESIRIQVFLPNSMRTDDLHELEMQLLEDWPLEKWINERILVAVSGGADSVALLRALVALGNPDRILVGHVNHGLRDSSNDDRQFVEDLSHQLGLGCLATDVEAKAIQEYAKGEGLESAARKARYEVLTKTALHVGARYLVTAHTTDDQVETVLHNIIRGTGLAGLVGISQTRRLNQALTLVRPLLSISRPTVIQYLDRLTQAYRIDESNSDDSFTRNRIRNLLLPLLEQKFNPSIRGSIVRLAKIAADASSTISQKVSDFFPNVVFIPATDSIEVTVDILMGLNRFERIEFLLLIWREFGLPLQKMSYEHWSHLSYSIETGKEFQFSLPDRVVVSLDQANQIFRISRVDPSLRMRT